MLRNGSRLGLVAAAAVALAMTAAAAGAADKKAVERGKYLVALGGCFDCHTPGYFLGKPDMARYLGGSDVGFEMPGLGVFVAPNLTPRRTIVLAMIGGGLAQIGDLVNSAFKRIAGVKDSGWIFPGHGGLLDRFDSVFYTAPILYVYWVLIQNGFSSFRIMSA